MYIDSVRIFVSMLENLDRWIDKAAAHAQKKSFDVSVLLSSRLAPDMFALTRQVQAACDAAKFAAARTAGKDAPRHEDNEKTVDELHARVRAVVEYLKGFSEKDFDGADARVVPLSFMPGKGMKGRDYLTQMALPNFFFHVTTAYAILRHNGVELGKIDYIGAITLQDL